MVDPMSETDFQVMLCNDTPVMQLPNRLSVLEAVAFKDTCNQVLQRDSLPQEIIFDFSQTTFIDSCGIGALVSNYKNAQNKGVAIVLKGVSKPVMAVLTMTGLDQILTVEPLAEPRTPSQLPTTHSSVRSWVKRFVDIVGGIVGLVITAIAFIPIAIAIKLDTPGPIFFGQIRCGWMGKQFWIWKFRSMYVGTEDISQGKIRIKTVGEGDFSDSRVTRVGQFLRKTSLDELPQFLNVLKGEMSLVGTRPPTPDEVDYYEVPEWQRLDVKPGMTGEWQVNGRNQIHDFKDIIELDLRYQRNWSLIYDLKLIFKTIFVVFSKNSGAV
ncbi:MULTISPECIES: anti-sigma factor antagonist [unclassified Coleofasciculus]|uniref:anti-sigma factor antagonist n=1 Tax=unclassified Coleofasciculus TaxID=2692782 RepID=UPI0018826B84|nr:MULTISPECIES: anti-sigma factor antagonist [unclassified Coleofasciculus]MBE9125097.1 anti-sigma factor antagonist [Coleofasciculus sp. LEGE 07081]MBE9150100.1 anti-sigma factor antagonist [Coleofasciculus sp. LEGE 07092]